MELHDSLYIYTHHPAHIRNKPFDLVEPPGLEGDINMTPISEAIAGDSHSGSDDEIQNDFRINTVKLHLPLFLEM